MVRWWRKSEARMFESNQAVLVVEPDLDMSRKTPSRSPLVANVSRVLHWMLPQSKAIGAPTRAVAREQEEVFPSREQ